MTESETVIYRVIPKCACSTIGQMLYYTDHGFYFDGDIHDAENGIHKWEFEASRPLIESRMRDGSAHVFTCVRNPYSRILSCYFDKVCGIQRNGTRYFAKIMPLLKDKYGIEVGGKDGNDEFDQITSFRRFLHLVRDTMVTRHPVAPNIHWIPMDGFVTLLTHNGGRFDSIFRVENFNEGMRSVLDSIELKHPVNFDSVPRFNESQAHGPKRLHPVEEYFDDESLSLMQQIYKRDFDLFKYDRDDPARVMPLEEMDLNEINAITRS